MPAPQAQKGPPPHPPVTQQGLPSTWVVGVTNNNVEVDIIKTQNLCIYVARGLQHYNGDGAGLVVLRKIDMVGEVCQ